MLELLQNYTIAEIVSFIVILALAIKALISFLDWAKDRLFKFFKKEEKGKSLDDTLSKIIESQEQLSKEMKKINSTIEILIHSDKDDIKSFIVKEHHHFCYNQGWIDDYSMDVIEKRFKHYQDEGGNSYIEELMKDLRQLEHRPPQQ